MTNIRDKTYPLKKYKKDKEINDCLNCKDCLCEDLCEEYEDDNYRKKVIK